MSITVSSEAMSVRSDPVITGDPRVDDLEPYRRELTGYCYRMLGSGSRPRTPSKRRWSGPGGTSTASRAARRVRSWLYRIATNVCLDMLRGRQRRARPMELGPSSPADPAHLGPMARRARPGWHPSPTPGSARERGPGRAGRQPGVHPAGLRGRSPAPAGPPTGGAHPVRGPAVAGHRGGRAARHFGGVGQQRAPAGPGHASPSARSSAASRRSCPSTSSPLLARYVDAFERYDMSRLVSAAPR